MRIVILTTWYPTRSNPARTVFTRRHAEAVARRHEVHVVAVGTSDDVPWEPGPGGLRVEHVRWSARDVRSTVRAAAGVRRRVAALAPDVVHTMGFSSLAFGAAVSPRAWVHTEHWSGTAFPSAAGRAAPLLRVGRNALRLPHRVTVVSEDMARRVAPATRRGRVDVVGNVVDPAPRLVAPPSAAALRLTAVGRLVEDKDPLLAVRVVDELRRTGTDVTLRWAGDGPLEDPVRAEVRRLGLEGSVELLGRVHPDAVASLLDDTDVFLLTSRHETFCVAAAEALAHGRPVVVGGRGGARDFVHPGVGALVDSRDPRDWAVQVREVRGRLGDTPPEDLAAAVARFSPEQVGAAFDAVYRRALSR